MTVKVDKLISNLLRPQAYSHRCSKKIVLKQTHISWIILTGEYVYKIKKPVNFGFLDFSTLEKRREFCEKEIQLNKRYAPDIYLSVMEIRGTDDHPSVGSGNGLIIEYAVKMAQFPQNQLLSDLAQNGQLTHSHIDQLALVVSEYHRHASRTTEGSLYGSPQHVEHWMLENFGHIAEDLETHSDTQALELVHRWVKQEGHRLESKFEQRKLKGKIRDCHGDLHLGNLTVIGKKITSFDCIEFNDELRWIDVINEVAFVMMDLDEKKFHRFANYFINRYLQKTGDYDGLKVLPYYLVYRAIVRAKVAILRRQQLPSESTVYENETVEFRRYILLAQQYITRSPPMLMITFGLSGSGKSTFAGKLCEYMDAIHIRSDIERKRLTEVEVFDNSHSPLGEGIYTHEKNAQTYERLAELAKLIIDARFSTIVDATFLNKAHRLQMRKIAHEKGVRFLILHCVSPKEILRERIIRRGQYERDASEATSNVLDAQLKKLQPLSAEEKRFSLEIDTNTDSYDVDQYVSVINS